MFGCFFLLVSGGQVDFVDFCCCRKGFLRAWAKEVLFLLMNKLLAAKKNIAKLNKTERVLQFKRLVLF